MGKTAKRKPPPARKTRRRKPAGAARPGPAKPPPKKRRRPAPPPAAAAAAVPTPDPAAAAAAAAGHRERMARRSREAHQAVSDVGEIPPVKDPARKARCRLDLHRFLTTYFPHSTGLSPFSADHKRVIRRMELCILEGGRFVNAVYRGFAKTTVSENAALWAVLYGHLDFVALLGADAPAAKEIIDSIKLELEENDLLAEDFPEVCHAIRKLEGKVQRCGSQTHKGRLTHIEWRADKAVLPRIAGSPASGAVLVARGMTGGGRGLKHKTPDGRQLRPRLVILDDPQTDDAAATPPRVTKTLGILRKKILRLGTHRRPLAVIVNATVIEPDDAIDQLLDPGRNPAWDGERIAMVKRFAEKEAHEKHWLGEYARLRHGFDRADPADKRRAHAAATAYYKKHRAAMDAGAEVSWRHCYEQGAGEISALQHAYNILLDDGEEAFASECQNQPLRRPDHGGEALAADQVAARVNRYARRLAPVGVAHLTAFVDVQHRLLYYVVCGWEPDFTGYVLDYGAWPDQQRPYFTLRAAPRPIDAAFAAAGLSGGLEAQLRFALDRLAGELLGREWRRDDGAALRVGRCLVDSGDQQGVVLKFCRESAYAAVLTPSKGFGVGPKETPLAERKPKPGETPALAGYLTAAQGAARVFNYDTYWWKSFARARLQTAPGGKGALTLFGEDPGAHELFADHVAAETFEAETRKGRTVDVWELKPGRPDNHWWDGLVGCAAAAAQLGAKLPDLPAVGPAGPLPKRDLAEWFRERQAAQRAGGAS